MSNPHNTVSPPQAQETTRDIIVRLARYMLQQDRARASAQALVKDLEKRNGALRENYDHLMGTMLTYQTILPDGRLGVDVQAVIEENVNLQKLVAALERKLTETQALVKDLEERNGKLRRDLDTIAQSYEMVLSSERAAHEATKRERDNLMAELKWAASVVRDLENKMQPVNEYAASLERQLGETRVVLGEAEQKIERTQTALRNARIYVDRMTIQVGPVPHEDLWLAKRVLQLIDAVLEAQ